MMKRIVLSAACLILLCAAGGTAIRAESLKEAVKGGDVLVDFRYRYEFVDDEGFSKDAEASTARLRLGYRTGLFHGVYALGELEGLAVIGGEQYNSNANGLTDFPLVPDPDDEEINQIYVGYEGLKNTDFRLGRQRITLDNHRFIGNVGWRQLEQTFDALSVKSQFTDKFTFYYSHLNNANRIFGENNPNPLLADTNLDGDLVNVAFDFSAGTLTGYAYLLDFEDAPATSQKNVGARFAGKHKFTDDFSLLYAAEYADQSDYEDGASVIDASYLLLEPGVKLRGVSLKAGYELLEGDGTYAFQTPLATGHKFNGWADKFLTTPDNGLEDVYFSVGGKVRDLKLLGVYHDFSADEGGDDYGTELDFRITWTFNEIYTVGGKFAFYESDASATDAPCSAPTPAPLCTDVDKVWVWVQVKI
jgi:hypothetical protein